MVLKETTGSIELSEELGLSVQLINTKKKTDQEKQVAEAFNVAIKKGSKVIGIILKKNERRIDIGTPESYAKVLGSLR